MHSSWGNTIERSGRVRAHGRRRDALAVLRPAARPQPALRVRPGARDQAQAAHALELRRVPRHVRLASRASSRATPTSSTGRRASCNRSTAGSSRARGSSSPTRPAAYEAYLTVDVIRAFEAFVDDLSNWYIRRSRRASGTATRRRCGRSGSRSCSRSASWRRCCRSSPSTSGRRSSGSSRAPDSIHLAGWPEQQEPDDGAARGGRRGAPPRGARASRAAELGLEGAPAAAAARRRRAPLAEAHSDELADELRVKEVVFGPVEATSCG